MEVDAIDYFCEYPKSSQEPYGCAGASQVEIQAPLTNHFNQSSRSALLQFLFLFNVFTIPIKISFGEKKYSTPLYICGSLPAVIIRETLNFHFSRIGHIYALEYSSTARYLPNGHWCLFQSTGQKETGKINYMEKGEEKNGV